jgi:hypothetical protein
MKLFSYSVFIALSIFSAQAQIRITVDPANEIREISPGIFGRNNSLSDDPSNPTPSKTWQIYKDAGVRFFRESGGNNSTKYNWRKKLSSHPDWYNNVYAHDWDYAAKSLQTNMPEARGMWSFQLLGHVAKTNAFNFNEWEYNRSQWWPGVYNNWCGGGGPEKGDGDPNTYLEPWPADSTVAILKKWFDKLGFSKEQFQYWNMDNEPECWHSTHKDVMPKAIPAEDFIQRYVAVATKARTLFPEIKIVGPVFTNEWFWYNWQNGTVPDLQNPGKKYAWVEYFIKRIAEEQQRTGMRLLDVLDFHFYPEDNPNIKREVTLQLHRVFYDTTYDYPGANGCKVVNGIWDNNITKEYIFKRSNDWLEKYIGANHGVTMGMTEMGALYNEPNVIAVCYASLLGTFSENNVELFAPWDWYIGQWEVLHLFTKYTGCTAVRSTSTQNNLVSAYSSVNAGKDLLSVVLVNRDVNNSQAVSISLVNKALSDGKVSCYQLANLPATETFVSATQNALKRSEATVANDAIAMSLPKLSVTVVQIPLNQITGISDVETSKFRLYPNPARGQVMVETSGLSGTIMITLNDITGRIVESVQIKNGSSAKTALDISRLNKGVYMVSVYNEQNKYSQKLVVE